jgi:hypothetical protein
MDPLFKVDGLRTINSTYTQVRRLEIVSAITRKIAKNQIPLELLKSDMILWSHRLEKVSSIYAKKNGRLTIDGKVTTAFKRYINLMKEMGLIQQIGGVVFLTTLGLILLAFTKENNVQFGEVSYCERVFYLNLLFTVDCDYLLLVLDMLKEDPVQTSQSKLQEKFKKTLLLRLECKSKFANKEASSLIRDRILKVTNEWKKAESYSEHIIAPRLEWLIELNILIDTDNQYSFTREGMRFMNYFPNLVGNGHISDVNRLWNLEQAFNAFRTLAPNNKILRNWSDLNNHEQVKLIGQCLELSSKNFKSGSALRIGLQPSLIFSAIHSFCSNNIVVEFFEIVEKLKESIVFNRRLYQIKLAARQTESYIIIKLINK